MVVESIHEKPVTRNINRLPFLEYVLSAVSLAHTFNKVQIFEQSPTSKRNIINLVTDGKREFDVSTVLDKIPSVTVQTSNMISTGQRNSKSVAQFVTNVSRTEARTPSARGQLLLPYCTTRQEQSLLLTYHPTRIDLIRRLATSPKF
jgi:hypothetical protein